MSKLIHRPLAMMHYVGCWQMMRRFTDERGEASFDEIWTLEHPPVYTLGQAGELRHLRGSALSIPLVQSDRGGEITYHGPGQIMFYTLCDLKRLKIPISSFIRLLEQVTLDVLAGLNIVGARQHGAPGVYVANAKVAALGLRVRRGCTYHGLSLNVDVDLSPYDHINPCGFENLALTSLKQLGVELSYHELICLWIRQFKQLMNYT